MLLVSAVALLKDNTILLQQRPQGKPMAGLWEFPGGKIEANETPQQALIRELHEELAISVSSDALTPLTFVTHLITPPAQPDASAFHATQANETLLLLLFTCSQWNGTPVPQENQRLAWVARENIALYDMPPADKPLLAFL